MPRLPDPLIEACAKACLIETRAQAIASYARKISDIPDPATVEPEEWIVFYTSLEKLLGELKEDIDFFARKAECAT